MEITEFIIHAFIILGIILIILVILYFLSNQMWAMQLLKNKCIVDCIEINRQAGQNICVC